MRGLPNEIGFSRPGLRKLIETSIRVKISHKYTYALSIFPIKASLIIQLFVCALCFRKFHRGLNLSINSGSPISTADYLTRMRYHEIKNNDALSTFSHKPSAFLKTSRRVTPKRFLTDY